MLILLGFLTEIYIKMKIGLEICRMSEAHSPRENNLKIIILEYSMRSIAITLLSYSC